MTTLEMRYRRLLRAYSPAYRKAHGEEILGTLMEASRGRERPSLRETAGLIGGGLTARLRGGAEHPVSWWADGLHLGVFLIALTNLSMDLAYVYPHPWNDFTGWVIGFAVLVLALWRGWTWVALPLASIATFLIGRPLFGRVFDEHLAHVLPRFGPGFGSWGLVAPYLAVAAGLVVLAVRPSRRLRPRSWWWLAVPVIGFVSAHLHIQVGAHTEIECLAESSCRNVRVPDFVPLGRVMRTAMELLLLSAGIWATTVVRDLRWLFTAAIFMLFGSAPTVYALLHYPVTPTVATLVIWGVQAALLLAMAGAAYRSRRARA